MWQRELDSEIKMGNLQTIERQCNCKQSAKMSKTFSIHKLLLSSGCSCARKQEGAELFMFFLWPHDTCWMQVILIQHVGFVAHVVSSNFHLALVLIFKRLVGSGADQDNSTLESFAYLAKMCSKFSFFDKKFVKLSTADLHSIWRIFNPFNANWRFSFLKSSSGLVWSKEGAAKGDDNCRYDKSSKSCMLSYRNWGSWSFSWFFFQFWTESRTTKFLFPQTYLSLILSRLLY